MSVLSLSESNLINSVLKNPNNDFQKIIDIIEEKINQSEKRTKRIYENSIEGINNLGLNA